MKKPRPPKIKALPLKNITLPPNYFARVKPQGADFHGWEVFEVWADQNGVPRQRGDWENWWLCWKAGYNAAMNIQ
jgi:hypothetical protein